MGNVVFTSEAMLKERPQVVQAYVNGLLRGWQAALANPDASVDVMLKVTPSLEKRKELAILKATVPFIKGGTDAPIGVMDSAQWAQTRDILVKHAGLDAAVVVDSAFDNRFVEAAHKTAGK